MLSRVRKKEGGLLDIRLGRVQKKRGKKKKGEEVKGILLLKMFLFGKKVTRGGKKASTYLLTKGLCSEGFSRAEKRGGSRYVSA